MTTQPSHSFELSAFGDEISPELETQLDILDQLGIDKLDLRSVGNTNVVDLDEATVQAIHDGVTDRGMSVPVIGSPVGKVDVTGGAERSATREETDREVTSFDDQLDRLDRAIELAERFDADYVRVFSYYTPDNTTPETFRDEIVRRTERKVDRAAKAGVVLLHENVPGIYGEDPDRLLDLLETIDSPYFRLIFDAANFYKYGSEPYPDVLEQLIDYVDCVHVKDATRIADGDATMVPLGEGDIDFESILEALTDHGAGGWLSLEPHLSLDDPSEGLTGTDAFVREAQSLQALLERNECST